MKIKKGKMILLLLGALLLAGCRKETESEEQQMDVQRNVSIAVTDKIENIEALDMELEKNMAVIPVLGKKKLMLAVERLYKDKSRPGGYLDNSFTPKEIDTILSTIEGTWIVDEYVGFAPYSEIEQWMGGTYEEKRERYKETEESAEKNLPDFFSR